MSSVRPEYGPTLTELLRPHAPAWVPRALAAIVVAMAVAVAVSVALPGPGESQIVSEAAGLKFNFVHDERLSKVEPRPGEVLRLESRSDGRFVQSFSVLELELPTYEGSAGGVLAVMADKEIAALAKDREAFELVGEGKARVVEAAAYQVLYRARLGPRRLYGRLVLLPSPEPGARRGVKLLIEATPKAGVPRASDVGVRGLTKKPFRSFRFGTERP